MSEEETIAKEQRPRIAKLSVMSVILSVIGFFLGPISIIGFVVYSLSYDQVTSTGELDTTSIRISGTLEVLPLFGLIFSILSIIIGKIGLKKIVKSNGLLSGHNFVHKGRFISIITIIWIGIWIGLIILVGLSIRLYGFPGPS